DSYPGHCLRWEEGGTYRLDPDQQVRFLVAVDLLEAECRSQEVLHRLGSRVQRRGIIGDMRTQFDTRVGIGERLLRLRIDDPHKLAEFRDPRVQASEEEIARSLEGHWQEDLLFVLKEEQEGYEFWQKEMGEWDRQLEQYLQQTEDRSQGAQLPEEKRKGRLKKKKGNKPQFDLRQQLFRMTGTDLTQIDGVDIMTATTIISEAGSDMSKWKTEDHFVSWLCPDNRISGDKIIGK